MKSLRIAIRVVCILLILLCIAAGVLLANINAVIKTAITQGGSRAFSNQTTVGKVHLSYLRGSLLIEELCIGNPEGYNTEHAIRLGRIFVKLDHRTLFSDTIHVTSVEITDPQIIYEVGLGNSNIGTLVENLQRFVGGEKKAPPPAEKNAKAAPAANDSASAPASGGKKVVIDKVQISGARVTLSAKLLAGAGVPIPLPAVTLNDLGKADEKAEGVCIADAVKEITDAIFRAVTDALSNSTQSVGNALKSLFGHLNP